jgi:hypothetical protein
MRDTKDLTTLVPQGLIGRLKAHFTEKIEEAVERYRFNDADEDALTGALGHALSTPRPIVVTVFKGAVYSFAIESYKILGKGPGTPESRTGADGIIQISVESDGKPIFAKGLPFQAKKLNRFHEAEVAPQAEHMFRTSGSGIVLRFGPNGYDARDVRHSIPEKSDEEIPTPQGFAPLGTVLGDWFLKCEIGMRDLTFHRKEPDPNVDGKRGFWVVDTKILKAES